MPANAGDRPRATGGQVVAADGPWVSEQDVRNLEATAARLRVLVVGSLNVDEILRADAEPVDDGAVVVRDTTVDVGGHAGNGAAALAALGVTVSLAGAVGGDDDGDLLVEDLTRRGIDVTGVRRLAGVRTGRVVIPVFGERHYMLLCRGANDALAAADLSAVLRRPFDAVMLFDPSREALLEVVRAAGEADPPPTVYWTPGGVYAGDGVVAEVLEHCDVVLLNRDEYRRVEARVPGLGTQAAGPEVVLTLGAEGALVRVGGAEYSAPAHDVEVVDPTGAGDAFAAAYLLAREAGLDPARRLATANMGGALAVGAIGARARQATLADILAPRAALRGP